MVLNSDPLLPYWTEKVHVTKSCLCLKDAKTSNQNANKTQLRSAKAPCLEQKNYFRPWGVLFREVPSN